MSSYSCFNVEGTCHSEAELRDGLHSTTMWTCDCCSSRNDCTNDDVVRYKCLACPDFDFCSNCFYDTEASHQHTSFTRIDIRDNHHRKEVIAFFVTAEDVGAPFAALDNRLGGPSGSLCGIDTT